MVERPSEFIEQLLSFKPDCITYHLESSGDISNLIQETKKANCKVGIALNHDTSIDKITEELMSFSDKIVVMSVITGFSGQPFINSTFEKVARLKKRIKDFGFKHLTIEVDGALDENNIPILYQSGATSYVLGSKGLFIEGANYFDQIKIIKNCIENKKLKRSDLFSPIYEE